MKFTHVELRRVALPLVAPFRASHGVERVRDALLVRVLGPDGEGTGECVAMSEPHYTSEYVDGAQDVVRRYLAPLLGRAPLTAAEVATRLAPVRGHPMAKASLEAAVLDAELRAAGTSFAAALGVTRDRVPAGVSIGITASIAELLDLVGARVDEGYARVKLKIEPGWDVEPVRAVRERFGDALVLQVDANGAYSLADAAQLQELDPYRLALIEQPLAEDDLAGHALLAALLETPMCLDESITSVATARTAIDCGACEVVNLKPGRVGGFLEAVRIHALCVERGVPLWCGGMFETGLGRAGNVALAALPGFTLPGDLSASSRYFTRDITDAFELVDGHLLVPTGPGFGVTLDETVLAEVTTQVEFLPL